MSTLYQYNVTPTILQLVVNSDHKVCYQYPDMNIIKCPTTNALVTLLYKSRYNVHNVYGESICWLRAEGSL